jgi:hypothetical protein
MELRYSQSHLKLKLRLRYIQLSFSLIQDEIECISAWETLGFRVFQAGIHPILSLAEYLSLGDSEGCEIRINESGSYNVKA